MRATIVLNNNKYENFIAKYIEDSDGISDVEFTNSNNKFTFNFSTHNAMEGLREKLVKLGCSFELIY